MLDLESCIVIHGAGLISIILIRCYLKKMHVGIAGSNDVYAERPENRETIINKKIILKKGE